MIFERGIKMFFVLKMVFNAFVADKISLINHEKAEFILIDLV